MLSRYNLLYFSRDRTELERDAFQNASKELDGSNRETGLVIRYRHGLPIIVIGKLKDPSSKRDSITTY